MKKQQRTVRRLLYRNGLTNNEVDRLIAVIGLRRTLDALDRSAAPTTHLLRNYLAPFAPAGGAFFFIPPIGTCR
jgi:hypothetical protein